MHVVIVAGKAVKTRRGFILLANLVLLSNLWALSPIWVKVSIILWLVRSVCSLLSVLMVARLILTPVLVPSMN